MHADRYYLGLLPKGAVGFPINWPWALLQGILEIFDMATLLRALKMKASLHQICVKCLDGNLMQVILQDLHAQQVDLRSVGAQRSNVSSSCVHASADLACGMS